jgi:flagellar hook-associated protein 3 FlgL
MDRVSTSGLYNSVVANLMSQQASQAKLTTELSTGETATDLAGYGASAETLTSLQSVQATTSSFLTQSNQLSSKLSIQDNALGQLGAASQAATTAVDQAMANGDGTTLMESLQSAYSDAATALNTTYNGEYIFAGGQVNTAPVTQTALSALTPPATVAGVFANDNHISTTQINTNTSIPTGQLASQLGTPLFNALQAIQTYEQTNGSFSGPLTPAQTSFLQTQLTALTQATTGVTAATAQNGVVQAQVASNITSLQNQQNTMQNLVGNLTSANMAQVATNLATAQQSIQASAQLIETLKNSSLVNILPVS